MRPFHQKSRAEQEIFLREIHLRKAKLHNATDLSVLFAFFSLLGAVDLNINFDHDTRLILAYSVTTALLVSNTVLVKISTLWMLPGLETALLLSHMDSSMLDSIPPLFTLWDWVWLLASRGNFLIFTSQFITLVWMKYPQQALYSSAIMGPVFILVLISFGHAVLNIGKSQGQGQRNQQDV